MLFEEIQLTGAFDHYVRQGALGTFKNIHYQAIVIKRPSPLLKLPIRVQQDRGRTGVHLPSQFGFRASFIYTYSIKLKIELWIDHTYSSSFKNYF